MTTTRTRQPITLKRIMDKLLDSFDQALGTTYGGGVTEGDILRMLKRHPLGPYLPIISYDTHTKTYHTTEDGVGFLFECSPLYFAGDESYTQIEALFKKEYPNNSVIQFIICSDDFIDPMISAYVSTTSVDNPVLSNLAIMQAEYMLQAKCGLPRVPSLPVRHFRLFVAIKFPEKKVSKLKLVQLFKESREILMGAGLHPRPMEPTALMHWLRRLFNPNKDVHSPALGTYNDTIPFNKQVILAESEVDITSRGIQIGATYDDEFQGITLRGISIKSPPPTLNSLELHDVFGAIQGGGYFADSQQIPCNFIFSISLYFSKSVNASIGRKASLTVRQQSTKQDGVTLNKKQQEFIQAKDDLAHHKTYVRPVITMWLYDRDQEKVDNAVSTAKNLWEAHSFTIQEESHIQMPAFLASLPFGLIPQENVLDNLVRDFACTTTQVLPLLPIQADFAAFSPSPIIPLFGRKGQLQGIDIFDPRAKSYNGLVAADTGTGKSVLMNYIIMNYLRTGAKVTGIDIGDSYRNTCRMVGGQYIDFENVISMNPFGFVSVGGDAEDQNENLQVVVPLIAQMAFTHDNVIDNEYWSLLDMAVKWAWDEFGPDAEVNSVWQYCKEFKQRYRGELQHADKIMAEKAELLSIFLEKWTTTKNGVYGGWVNGRSELNIRNNNFTIFELQRIKGIPDLFSVMSLILINAITMDLYLSDRSRKKIVLLEEAGQFLRESPLLLQVVNEMYRRIRKYGGGSFVVTQSLLDTLSWGDTGRTIMDNARWKFLLESDSFPKAKDEKLLDVSDFVLELMKSTKSRKPDYSEIFAMTPVGMGHMRLSLPPWVFYSVATDGPIVSKIEQLRKEGLSYDQAISWMVDNFRF